MATDGTSGGDATTTATPTKLLHVVGGLVETCRVDRQSHGSIGVSLSSVHGTPLVVSDLVVLGE